VEVRNRSTAATFKTATGANFPVLREISAPYTVIEVARGVLHLQHMPPW